MDDWVLCRIYNKKGSVEKKYPVMNQMKTEEFPEIEDRKPHIIASAFPNDHLHMETSDSIPRLHTDSSCSEHVLSPDVTCEREVQSEPKWKNYDGLDNALDFNVTYMDGFSEDPFGSQFQYQMDQLSPLQDMFTFMQKPF